MKKWISILLVSIAPSSSLALEDYMEFKSQYTNKLKPVVCSAEYLACLKIDKWECSKAIEQALPKCPFKDYYQSIMHVIDLENIEKSKFMEANVKLSECIHIELLNHISSSEKAKEQCKYK